MMRAVLVDIMTLIIWMYRILTLSQGSTRNALGWPLLAKVFIPTKSSPAAFLYAAVWDGSNRNILVINNFEICFRVIAGLSQFARSAKLTP